MIQRTSRSAPRALAALGALLLCLSCFDDKNTNPNAPVESIDIGAPGLLLAVDGTLQLEATPRDAGGAEVSADVSWESDDDGIATVDGDGLVEGVAAGDVRITASAEGKSASIDLAVREIGPELSGRIEKARIVLEEGFEYRATGDLELIADSLLRIDGTLLIEDGVAVSAGSFDSTIITGSILPSDTHATKSGGPGLFGWGPRHDEPKDVVLFAVSLLVDSKDFGELIQSTGNVLLAGVEGSGGSAGECVLRDVEIEGGRGALGTASSRNGGPGGSVEIGTSAARAAVEAAAHQPGLVFPFVVLQETVALRGGPGGDGYSIRKRSEATVSDNKVVATGAGNGGRGGSVMIEAGLSVSLSFATAGLVGGGGGGGGSIEFDVSPDRILDGSGPNGEGESLDGTTGSGGDGGDAVISSGSVQGASGQLIQGGRGGSPGWFIARGGNGQNGGRGGDFTARIGITGAGGSATIGGGPLPAPNPPDRAVVRVDHSMSGGAATSASSNGGAAGNLDVADVAGTEAGYILPVFASGAMNGGAGFNGCLVEPKTNGTDGGPAGTIRTRGVGLGESALSFLGGAGGDGTQPGTGGSEGRNLDTDQPLGAKGPDGTFCPQTAMISADVTELVFQHVVFVTPCPQLIGTVTITNHWGSELLINLEAVGTNSIAFGEGEFFLGAGESRAVPVYFNCNRTTSFTGTVRITGALRTQDQMIEIPVTGTVGLPVRIPAAPGS